MTPTQKYSLLPNSEFGDLIPQEIYLRGWQRAESFVRIIQAQFLCDGLPLARAEGIFDEAFRRIDRYSQKSPSFYAMAADFGRCPWPEAADRIFVDGFCDALSIGREETMDNPTYHGPSLDDENEDSEK